jgi:DNA-binding transcriptional MerR regulator
VKLYDTNEAAAALDIEPRYLRRYLRNSSTYANAGQGGRYMFTEADVRDLRHIFKPSSAKVPAPLDTHYLDDDPGVPLSRYTAAKRDPRALHALREARRDARALRQQRLIHAIDTRLERRYDDEPVAW